MMYTTVYVDSETFYSLVLEGEDFDAVTAKEVGAEIAVHVLIGNVVSHTEPGMVTVLNR